MENDTDLGGPAAAFPGTRASVVRSAASSDAGERRQAWTTLIALYWKPIYKYLRVKQSLTNEDAKDLTQAFFTGALDKGFFDRYDPSRARFRTFLRVCVDHFVANHRQSVRRLQRGGDREFLPLDFAAAEDEIRRQYLAGSSDPDELFRREWLRSLFALAVDDLRQQCESSGKTIHFALFERYDLEGPDAGETLTYDRLAAELGLSITQVTNHLAAMRREFRRLILDHLRAATGSEEEFREEAQRLLGGGMP
jgi:RNA polymerase sigma factor (sigma-70 family)